MKKKIKMFFKFLTKYSYIFLFINIIVIIKIIQVDVIICNDFLINVILSVV